MIKRLLLLLLLVSGFNQSFPQDAVPPPPDLSHEKDYDKRIERYTSYCREILALVYKSGSNVDMSAFVKASREGLKLVKPTDTFNKALYIYFVGAGFQHSSRYDSAIVHLTHSIALFRKIKAVREEVNAIRYLHYAYYFTGQGVKRDPYIAYLRQLLPKVKDTEIKVSILGTLSEYAHDHAAYETAIKYKLQAIALEKDTIARAKGKPVGNQIAITYLQIAETYQALGNAEKMIYYLDAAQPYVENNAMTLNTMYLNYMAAYVMLDKEREVLRYFNMLKKHLKGREAAGNHLTVAYQCMADYYVGKKNFSLAQAYSEQGLKYAYEINSPQKISDAKTTLGGIFYYQKDFPKAIKYLEPEVANTYKFARERFANTNLMLAESYAALNDHKKAYDFYRIYSKQQDSIYEEASKKSIAEMDAKYHREASVREIKLLNAENDNKNQALSEARRTRWFLIGAVAIILIIALLIYRNYKNKQRTNLLLDKKNRELDNINVQLSAANDTKAKLFSIISHDLRSPVSQLFTFLRVQKESPQLLNEENRQAHQDQLISASERLLETLEDLLMWSKSQMDHFDIDPENVDVKFVFNEIKSMMQAQAEAKKQRIELGATNCETVFADQNLLLVVLRNLVQNAINHAPPETAVTLSCDCAEGTTKIRITNQGAAIPAEKIAELLNATRVKSSSSGYGLMIVNELLQKINGRLEIESREGETVMRCVFDAPVVV